MTSFGSSRTRRTTLSRLQPLQCDMTRYRYKYELDAESQQNPPDLEKQFLHRWVHSTRHSFGTADFSMEKSVREH
jgi:hypothetical protein